MQSFVEPSCHSGMSYLEDRWTFASEQETLMFFFLFTGESPPIFKHYLITPKPWHSPSMSYLN